MTIIQAIYEYQTTIQRGSRGPQVIAGPDSLSTTRDILANRPEVKHKQWDSKDRLQLKIRGTAGRNQTGWLPIGEEIEFADIDAFIRQLGILKPENLESIAARELQAMIDADSPV